MTLHEFRLLGLSLLLLPCAARAEDAREVPDVLNYTFEDDLVGANRRSSDLMLLHVRMRKARESLVRVRENFIPELYKSVEDL